MAQAGSASPPAAWRCWRRCAGPRAGGGAESDQGLFRLFDDSIGTGTVRANPSAKPWAIDFEHTEEAIKGEDLEGHLYLDGDTLTICDNAPNLELRNSAGVKRSTPRENCDLHQFCTPPICHPASMHGEHIPVVPMTASDAVWH
jgi:hypothetical protein